MRHFLTSLFLLFAACIHAQQTTGFHIQKFGTEDGLPSNGIKGLQWDKSTGFLWIATEAGMVRYNGMSFKTFSSEDNPNITNERILFLVRNNAGKIFTADNSGNIFSIAKNSIRFLAKKNLTGNSSTNVFTINISDQFYEAGHKIKGGPYALQFDQVLPLNDTACYILHTGRLYYFSLSLPSPVYLPMPVENAQMAFICGKEIFITDPTGQPWLLDQKKNDLSRITMYLENSPGIFDAPKTTFLWENGMQNPILITGDKAWKVEFNAGRLSATLICNVVPQDALVRYAQYDDATHTLFIGTDSKGLIIIKQNLVEPLRKNRTSANERSSYYSQVELPDGNVMTNEGHILGKNNPGGYTPPFIGPISNSTFLDGDSVFWFVQRNKNTESVCLHSYNYNTRKLTPYPKVRQNYSQLIMTVAGGRLYLASEFGILLLDGDSVKIVYKYPDNDKKNIHFDIKEVTPGVLAIAKCNSLMLFDTKTNKLTVLYDPGNYCVRSLWVYKEYLFFGTYGNGLYISKNGIVKALPLDKNKYLLFTHCFIEDENGYCWISTNRGLFKANIAEMINAYEKNNTQVYYHYFGRQDGMNMTEMNGGCTPCGLKLKNKIISFPTMEGLLWVNPLTAKPELPQGDIFVDEVMVDNKRVDPLSFGNTELTARVHDIQVRLGFSAWCNKENIYIDYRVNDETDWKPLNIDNGALVHLANLQSGKYTLQIRKLNGFGVNNYSYKEIRFSIPTPWYKQWWFVLLITLTLMGVIALYLQFRTRQYKIRQRKLEQQVAEKTKELQQQNEVLEKNNTIKTRLISIISHDIVTPLKFLTVAGKNLLEKRKIMNEELQQETIQEMANTSQELQLLSTNILNWIKYQNENRRLQKETFSVNELVNQVFGVLNSLSRQKKIQLANNTDAALTIYQYQEPLKILIYNLVSNAINFSEQGTIAVSNDTERDHIIIRVKDDGVGMTPEQIQNIMADQFIISSANIDNRKGNGLGYLIIKDLLKMMGASLRIESEKGKGTLVSVLIPAANPR